MTTLNFVSSGYRSGVLSAVPLAIAVGIFGIVFGVLARSAGMGVVAPIVMSATSFAGSAQFAVASVLGAGGNLATAVTAAVLLNARYGPIGVSVAPYLSRPLLRRFVEAQLVVDESWAVATRPDGTVDRRVLVGAGLTLWLAWIVGTTVGVLGGSVLADPEALGLDAAFPALFLALLARQLRSRRALVAALAGTVIALVLVPFTSPGVPIVAACAGAAVGLWRTETPRE